MPGFDGTGPRGLGPMTGGGRGFCNPYMGGMRTPYGGYPYAPYQAYPYGGFGWGRGFGRGFGMGRGMGRWWMWQMPFSAWTGMPPLGPPMPLDQELNFFKSQAEMLRQQLEQINARVTELESAQSNNPDN